MISMRRTTPTVRYAAGVAAAFVLVMFSACNTIPRKRNWDVCSAEETSCLPGFSCDIGTWSCIRTVLPDAGADAPPDVSSPDTHFACNKSPDCHDASKPACDLGTHECVACVENSDCTTTAGRGTCDLASHLCVECVEAADCKPNGNGKNACDTTLHACVGCVGKSDCAAPTPACDPTTRACVGCLAKTDCAAPTPACDIAARVCVGCLGKTDCAAPNPVCDTTARVCVGCLGKSDCAAPTGICDTTVQTCVGCLADTDCSGSKPLCDKTSKACVACSGDAACATKSSAAPACASTGACVVCVDSKKHCTTAATPICDGGTNACRVCSKDSECAAAYGANPGLCVGGQCATDAQVIYTKFGVAGCSATQRGDGSAASPLCLTAGDAVAKLSVDRHIILIRGPTVVDSLSLAFAGAPVVVVGQNQAVVGALAGAATALVSVTAGDVTLRDLTISGATAGGGVSASGGATLHVNRCRLLNNSDTGIVTKNAAFDIENTVIANNGGSNNPGVNLGTLPSGVTSPATFTNNTVIGNGALGVTCGAAYTLAGNIISGNGGLDTGPACVVPDTCKACTDAMLDKATYSLLPSATACLDKLGAGFPSDDLNGQARPQGAAADCGAAELKTP